MSNLFGASGSFQSQTGAKTSGFSATTSTSATTTTTTNNININSNSNGNNSGNSRKLVESNQRRRGATAGTDEQRIETSAKAEVGREIAVSGGGGGGGGGGGSGGGTSASSVSTRVGARESATSARQARAGSQFVAEASGGARASASGDIVESRAGQRVASSSASSSSSSPTPASTSALTSASVKRQQQYTSSGSGSSTTSNTQRLSSIEILNENKQRQLQLEQQESFKQHLEKRQKFIQQQQQSRQSDFNSAYQVETSAPEYARMASAAAAAAAATSATNPTTTKSQQQQQQVNGSSGQKSISTTATLGSGRARNPFDEESRELQSMTSQQRRQQQQGAISKDGADPGTVSGRSGFLAALMGDSDEAMDGGVSGAKGSAVKQQVVDESCDELSNGQGHRGSDIVDELVGGGGGETRYSKVAQSGACSYNYDEDPHRQPFYKRDLATLLQDCRGSRKLVILIVAVALLLDNMLLTAVVPIIPAYLYKLRVEREHREAIGAPMNMNRTGAAAGGKSAAGRFGSLDTNQDGRVDEDELAAELERRINQSLANVQDRFSGSVFNPRVLSRKPAPLKKQGGRWNKGDDSGGDDDDDDDDDSDDDDGVRGRDQGRKRKGRFTRAKSAAQLAAAAATSQSGASKSSSGSMNIDDNDDYEASDADDDDDDGGGGGGEAKDSKNGKVDREKQQASDKEASGGGGGGAGGVGGQRRKFAKAASRVRAGARSGGRGDSGDDGDDDGANEDDDDDDDEDVAATKKWNKLRTSLMTMAKMSGNDTDALGGMCLSMVLGRPTYFDQSQPGGDAGVKSPTKGQRAKSDRMTARVRGQSKDDDDDDDDDREDEPAEKSSMRGGRNKSAGQRNSEKWVAPGGEATSRKLSQPARVDRIRPPSSSRMPAGGRNEIKQPEVHDGDTGTATIGDDEVVINHQDIVDESFEVGVMFASKPIVQAIANPFVGAITNRVGFTLPMFLGFTTMFLSTLVFAFGSTYATLFAARAIQGVGSACTSVAGMSMIADRFPDDAERGNAMAVALGGLALGVVIGPPFGGFMYEFFGKPSPFIVLACLALLDGLLQLLVLQPRVTKCTEEGASLLTLIKDPYILVAAGAITFANTGIGILEPALPLWMMDTMQAKNWEQGVAFLPAALSYLFSTNLFGNLGLRIGRWRSAMLGLIVIGCALLLIPFATRVDHLILPNGAIGFAIGMVDSTMMPMLGYLVDIRHTSVYGSVYAIGDVAFCASFVFGPALSGTLVELIGFEGLIITTALICFGFAPLLIMLKDPPARQVNEAQLQEQSTLRYVNYNHLDSPDEEAQLTADPKYKHYQHISTPATSKTTVR